MSDRNECLEVGSLDETEIVRVDAEHIIHHYPAVLADAFPDIGSLAAFRLVVYLSSYIVVTCIYLVRKSNLDSPGVFLRYICHCVSAFRKRAYVGIKHLYLFVRIFIEFLRHCHESGEIFVGICVIESGFSFVFCRAFEMLAFSSYCEIHHHRVFLRIINCLGSPGTTDFSEFFGKKFVKPRFMVSPVYEIGRFHQYKSTVVAPSVFIRSFPFRLAETVLFRINV